MTLADHAVPGRPADTSPEAYAVQMAVYRRMTPEQRTTLAIRMSEDAQANTLSGIRSRHPEWSEERCRWQLHRLMHGRELTEAAWGPPPEP